jgi:hypothetical protein
MRKSGITRIAALTTAFLAAGCGGCSSTGTLSTGEPAPPPVPVRTTPEQSQLAPQAKPITPTLAPTTTAPHSMAVMVKTRTDGLEGSEDAGAEAMLCEALEAEQNFWPADAPRFEVVNRQAYEKALRRDLKGLSIRGREPDAKILESLAGAGVDLLVAGNVDISSVEEAHRAFETKPKNYSVEAAVSIVRVDDATTLGAGAGSARGTAAVEAKRLALRDAAREALQGYRAAARSQPVVLITLTIEGLRSEADSACVVSALRAKKGILWVKPGRFQLVLAGEPSSVGRYELGWNGDTEDLKSIFRAADLGFRLEGTQFEGSRWNFRASGFPPTPGAESKAITPTEEAKP